MTDVRTHPDSPDGPTDPRGPGPGSAGTRTAVWLLVATPLVLLVTHYVAVIPHEFAHSTVAWLLGLKPEPGNITWGGTSPTNVLLLWDINENVDYSAAFAAGRGTAVAMVAFAGPGLVNGGFYLLSRWLIGRSWFDARPVATYVLFWFLWINLANVYCYVPLRTFSDGGDVHHFLLGTGLSPWWVYAVIGVLVLWGIVDGYRRVIPRTLAICGFDAAVLRAMVLLTATAILFVYYALPAIWESDVISRFMGWTSMLLAPVVLVLTWRRIVPTPTGPAVFDLHPPSNTSIDTPMEKA